MSIGLFLSIVGVALVLAALTPFLNARRRQATLDLVEQELAIEREARLAQEIRYQTEIAELRGQLKVVTHEFAKTIAVEVVRVMRDEGVLEKQ